MIKVNIAALRKEIEVQRIIGKIKGAKQIPTMVFLAGIHGNETSGIYALQKVVNDIKEQAIPLLGNLYALSGNMNALKKGVRFEKVDLNRIWTHDHVQYIQSNSDGFTSDVNEKITLYGIVKDLLQNEKGPFYFIDIHSTSAQTEPFITISDSINNRKFSSNFPVPIILGIEEYLDGPFLSFINEFGHTALGFEAGQHKDIQAIHCSEAFIWMSLVKSGCIKKTSIKKYKKYQTLLANYSSLKGNFFEIDHRHQILKGDMFSMKPNFNNFDIVHKNQLVAVSNMNPIYAPLNGRIFMPLYQKQGDDGFFIVTKISKFWLILSKFMRRIQFHHFLRLLPGIRQYGTNRHVLVVNRRTARFLATEIFHLFGYRKKIYKEGQWLFVKRDRKITSLK